MKTKTAQVFHIGNQPCPCGSPRPTDAFGTPGKCDECGRPLVRLPLTPRKS